MQFALAVARLNIFANRPAGSQISNVAKSCLRSLEKLDDVLAMIIRPGSIRTGNLLYEHEGRNFVRKPVVNLNYSFDQFPARRGNLELWIETAEGYEDDFTIGLRRQKLLRVDAFEDTCEAAQGLDEHVDQKDALKVIESAYVVFRHVEGLVSRSFEPIIGDDIAMTSDPSTGILCEFRVGPGQEDQLSIKF